MSVSSCCSAEVKVSYGSEGTWCYLCSKCGKLCDAMPTEYKRGFDEGYKQGEVSEAGLRMKDLEAENDKLKAEVRELKKAVSGNTVNDKLANDLCEILIQYVGETGYSEGAVDVLKRKLAEVEVLKSALKMAVEALSNVDEVWWNRANIHTETNFLGDDEHEAWGKLKDALSNPVMKKVIDAS